MFKFISSTDRQRLDNFLTEKLEDSAQFSFLTRSQIKNFINRDGVSVNNKLIKKAGLLLKVNDVIEVDLDPLLQVKEIAPYDYPLDIVFEDHDVIVINKTADLTVHPGAGNPNRTLLNALANYFGKDHTIFLAHRLDKDTTGLILIAKNEDSRAKLVRQFANREVKRIYQALALVTPRSNREIQKTDSGRIETNYARNPSNKLTMAVVESAGRIAITNWQVLQKFAYAYLLELRLETGRTHQIRVHLNHLGSPIIGDQTYGDFSLLPRELSISAQVFGRQALHAKELEFIHPRTGKPQNLKSDLPQDFADLIDKFACYQ
ncbi:MAG: RluA family pseudouridine synthase [Candidatus Paceibacterota bacterium]